MALPQSAPLSARPATASAGGIIPPGLRDAPNPYGRPDPEFTWVMVDPDLAREWLRRNKLNRRMRHSVTLFYADQIAHDQWRQDTPEAIAFDVDGNLLQGQHRLEGIIEADRPVRLLVATGVAAESRLVLDTGVSRTGPDALHMRYRDLKPGQAQAFASAIRGLEAWRREPKKGPHENIASRIPNVVLVDKLKEYRGGLERFYSAADAIHHAPVRGGLGLWLTMLYAFGLLSVEQTLDFADKVATGANLPLAHPALTLRDRLNRMPTGDTKPRRQTNARLIVYAWNAYRERRSMRRMLLPLDTDFPVPV